MKSCFLIRLFQYSVNIFASRRVQEIFCFLFFVFVLCLFFIIDIHTLHTYINLVGVLTCFKSQCILFDCMQVTVVFLSQNFLPVVLRTVMTQFLIYSKVTKIKMYIPTTVPLVAQLTEVWFVYALIANCQHENQTLGHVN